MSKDRIVIDSQLSSTFSLKEVLRYKDLLYNLARRDFLVRYKQAIMGITWALVKPSINILVFGYIASKLLAVDSADAYLNVSVGMIIWQLFASVFTEVSNSIVGNANLFSKVYFPKIIIPLSSILVCLLDFLISCIIIIVLLIISDKSLHWELIFAPVFIALTIINGLGIGLFFATLFVKYRDVRYIVPVIIQFGMYASPVIVSAGYYLTRLNTINPNLSYLFHLNPMVGALEGFRYSLFGSSHPFDWTGFSISVVSSLIFLIVGIKYFYRFERNFVDYI